MDLPNRRIDSLKELWFLIKEDKRTNDDSWLRPGCQAMIMYRLGVYAAGEKSPLLRLPCSLLYKTLRIFIRNFYGIELYATATLGRRVRLAHQHGIIVHHYARIGDDCLLRHGATLGRTTDEGIRADAPRLGDRVEVGTGAVLAGGITIGDDVSIGPNAVVLKDVPANSFVMSPLPKVLPRPVGNAPAGE